MVALCVAENHATVENNHPNEVRYITEALHDREAYATWAASTGRNVCLDIPFANFDLGQSSAFPSQVTAFPI